MYFEILKKEIIKNPPIRRNPLITYTVNEGPNGSGKTAVSDKAASISSFNLYSSNDIYWTQEPPPIELQCLPTGMTTRDFLKGGMAGSDVKEQLGVFMLARRKLQEGIHGTDIFCAEGVNMVCKSTLAEANAVVYSDRGMPSSMIYQVRAEKAVGGLSNAEENSKIVDEAYSRGFLAPYDLVAFIYPPEAKSAFNPEDYWEGKCDEVRLYGDEIRARGLRCCYSDNVVWVENDPTGNTNTIEEPAISTAAATMAVVNTRHLEKGVVYYVPLRLPVDVQRRIGTKSEIRSGNIVVNRKGDEATMEITDNLPEVR